MICLFIYGRILCCVILREEHKLWVSENRMLREIFVCERDWETVGCRRVHSVEMHGECCWLNVTGWLDGMGGEIGKQLALGDCIVGSSIVSAADWMLLGDWMGRVWSVVAFGLQRGWRGRGLFEDRSGRRPLVCTEWRKWVQSYLGRPVWKKALRVYRVGEGGTGLFGETAVKKGN